MSRRRALGMTLLEVLVTLVIVGMVAGVASQALQQFARVERLLEEAGSEGQQRMLRREWLRQLVAGTLPQQVSSPLSFSGDEQGFSLLSAQPFETLGSGPLRVELEHDATRRRNLLRLRAQAPTGFGSSIAVQPEPIVLLRWDGEPGRIAYLDQEGAWQTRWPVPGADPEATRRPPALLRVELGPEAGGILLLPIATRESPRPRLADWVDG